MMDAILTLLNSNFATVIAVIISGVLIAFSYYVALPAIVERNQLREQLGQNHSPERVEDLVVQVTEELSKVTKQIAELNKAVADMQAHATATSRAEGTAQTEMYTVLDEIRQQLSSLAARFVSLSNTVNAMGGQRQSSRPAPDGLNVRGLR